MASRLASLIRLRDWDCEERRRQVATAQARADGLAADLRELVADRDHERAAAAALPAEARLGLAAYERRVRGERLRLAAELEAAVAAVAEARQNLALAYREKRKLELAEAARLRAEAAARARRESAAMDEIAANAASRR